MDYNPAVDLRSVFSPNIRQVSTFFLGGIFCCSIQCLVSSSLLWTLLRRLGALCRFSSSRSNPNTAILDAEASQWQEKSSVGVPVQTPVTEAHSKEDRSILLFILSFCFLLSSLGDFLSLITYGIEADTVCAFVIAWGDMSSHSARLVALFMLRSELKRLGMKSWESYLFLGWMLIGIGLLFANNSINIGVTSPIVELHVSTCIRRLYLPLSLTSSIFYIVFDIYVISRLSLLIMKSLRWLPLRHRLKHLCDIRIAQAISLLALEIMVVPPVLNEGLSDFVPFSIGVVLVLLTFHGQNVAARSAITPPLINISPVGVGIRLSPLKDDRSPAPVLPPISNHPFNAGSLNVFSHYDDEWQIAERSRSLDSLSANYIPCSSHDGQARPLPPGIGPMEDVPAAVKFSIIHAVTKDSGQAYLGSSINRQILPSQVEFAKQFEQETPSGPPPARRRQHISIVVSPTSDRDDVSHTGSTRTLNSALYGSDIIRPGTAKRNKDFTKRWSFDSRVSARSSPRDSLSTYASSAAQPFSTRQASAQELPILYEVGASRGSRSGSGSLSPAGVEKRRTFGNNSLRRAASKLARHASTSSSKKSPRGLPSHPRLFVEDRGNSFGNLKGPRPPPPSSTRPLHLALSANNLDGGAMVVEGRPRSESLPESRTQNGDEEQPVPSAV